MGKWFKTAAFLAVIVIMSVSCREMFTTSLGSAFADDDVSIPKNTPIADLITLSQSSEGSSPEAAKEILDVLAEKNPADIAALSVDDKTAILNLATSAAIDMATLSDIAQSSIDGTAGDSIVETALSAFDTTVNLAAVELLLTDPATLASAPIDTIVFASAVVLADIADEIGTTEMMAIMGGDATERANLLASNPDQLDRIDAILNARDILNTRPAEDLSSVEFSDFNLLDFLNGTEVTP